MGDLAEKGLYCFKDEGMLALETIGLSAGGFSPGRRITFFVGLNT
jgi:hypothetical protein